MRGARNTMLKTPWDANSPAVNKRLSPGRKNPKKRPDSAKTAKNMRKYPSAPKLATVFSVSMRSMCGMIDIVGTFTLNDLYRTRQADKKVGLLNRKKYAIVSDTLYA